MHKWSTTWCCHLLSHLGVIAHDVVESGEKAGARGDLRMHRPIHIVEQIEGLTDEVEALRQKALLDLVLSTCEHMVRVCRLDG